MNVAVVGPLIFVICSGSVVFLIMFGVTAYNAIEDAEMRWPFILMVVTFLAVAGSATFLAVTAK